MMKQIRLLLLAGILLITHACNLSFKDSYTITSPDKKLLSTVMIENGQLYYTLENEGHELIEASKLGFKLNDSIDLSTNFRILDVTRDYVDETWAGVWGSSDSMRNNYNQLSVRLHQKNKLNHKLDVYFRLYNDGLAFRYLIPTQDGIDTILIQSEESRFNFTDNFKAWWIPANFDSYEFLYSENLLEEIEAVNTPFTIQAADSIFIAVHEANLNHYPGMTLRKDELKIHGFKSSLVPWADGTKVKGHTPLFSPWRTIQVAKSAAGLAESHLIQNLNDPCQIQDVSWISTGNYIGIWWAMHIGYKSWTSGSRHGANTYNAKKYIDFAAENRVDAVLFEGWNKGWENWGREKAFDMVSPAKDFNLKRVVEYAKSKGVKIIMHHETGGDALFYEAQLDTALALCQELGIHLLKTGYAGAIIPEGEHHHGQFMVEHYRRVIEKAAQYKVMLDVHEPIKATGESRTFPNMMTREGVRGMEWNAWSEGNPPEHTCILPFTRCLAGPVDYTPGIFDLKIERYKKQSYDWNGNKRKSAQVQSTLAKQLALMLVLYSPWQMSADLIENYKGNPAYDFFKDFPGTWNESHFLKAEIGKYVIVARRNNSDWYLGAISDSSSREFAVPLSFLSPNQNYQVKTISDAPESHFLYNPNEYLINDTILSNRDTFRIFMAPGGGCAAVFQAVTDSVIREQ